MQDTSHPFGSHQFTPKLYKTCLEETGEEFYFTEKKEELIESLKKFRKVNSDQIDEEDFTVKDYLTNLTLKDARTKFAL